MARISRNARPTDEREVRRHGRGSALPFPAIGCIKQESLLNLATWDLPTETERPVHSEGDRLEELAEAVAEAASLPSLEAAFELGRLASARHLPSLAGGAV
ncbi:MAG: hypothetical protein WEA54_02320 [Actinomycetota bacterium]